MSVKLTGTAQLFKNIDKIARWSINDSKKLQDVGHRVGDVYAKYLSANVKDLGKDISVKNKGKIYKVKKGQLRRSAGTWQPTKNRNTILAGPRTKAIGKKGKTKKYDDGWFAHIVEAGDFGPRFGGKHRTQNTGVFARGIRATKSRSEKLQLILLKKAFKNYANRVKGL